MINTLAPEKVTDTVILKTKLSNILTINTEHLCQVTEVWLSCYQVLLWKDSKTR